MIRKRNGNHASMTSRTPVMALGMTDVRSEALFASPLQRSDRATPEAAAAAMCGAIQQFGPDGCICRMAQEFGDHPEEARDRMRWARDLVRAGLSPIRKGTMA